MKQKISHLRLPLIFMLGFYLVSAQAQVTKQDMDKTIDVASLQHPYLYFTEKEKSFLLERIKNDQGCNDIFRKLKVECNMLLNMPVDKTIPTQGKNPRTALLCEKDLTFLMGISARGRLTPIIRYSFTKTITEYIWTMIPSLPIQSWIRGLTLIISTVIKDST